MYMSMWVGGGSCLVATSTADQFGGGRRMEMRVNMQRMYLQSCEFMHTGKVVRRRREKKGITEVSVCPSL